MVSSASDSSASADAPLFPPPLPVPPHDAMPLVALDRDGTVRTTTRAARQLLEYGPEASLQSSFFGYVHPRHRRRVMRDLADMVSRGMRQAQWLLRLRTGNERWRWYRASAHNHLGDDAERVFVHLRPL